MFRGCYKGHTGIQFYNHLICFRCILPRRAVLIFLSIWVGYDIFPGLAPISLGNCCQSHLPSLYPDITWQFVYTVLNYGALSPNCCLPPISSDLCYFIVQPFRNIEIIPSVRIMRPKIYLGSSITTRQHRLHRKYSTRPHARL